MMNKRCVIIGSGLGGLSCGVILARNGWEVTVLEQHSQAGGCLQCFTRGGAKFETGMHFIGSARKGQTLHKLLNYLDVLKDIQLNELDRNGYEQFAFQGQRFKVANGRENFTEGLCRYFPKEKDHIIKYCDIIEKVTSASSLHNLRRIEANATVSQKAQLISIDKALDRITNDKTLKSVLSGNIPLYAAERGKTPFSTHAFIMDFYNQSAFRVVGGSDNIAQSLITTIECHGGEVYTSQRVTKIECNSERATAVITQNGERWEADEVIANLHPSRLVELVDSPLLRPAYIHRINTLPETIGCFTIYLHFKDREVPYINHNFYGYDQPSPWDCEKYTTANWPRGYLYMHQCNKQGQQWARNGIILSYMRWEEVSRWQGTKIGHRGNDYEEFKRRHAEKLLDLVEKDFPGLRSHLKAYYTSTPLTYFDYTGTEAGGMYGVAKDINLGSACRVHHRTKIPNLLITGQNINSHGILGVLVGTVVTCSELLGSEYIFNQIMEENR